VVRRSGPAGDPDLAAVGEESPCFLVLRAGRRRPDPGWARILSPGSLWGCRQGSCHLPPDPV